MNLNEKNCDFAREIITKINKMMQLEFERKAKIQDKDADYENNVSWNCCFSDILLLDELKSYVNKLLLEGENNASKT